MKEIIFWFSNSQRKNYWFKYAVNCLKTKTAIDITSNPVQCWIKFINLKISFKTNINDTTDLAGRWDINQYWVEDLFDNNFEEFFFTFVFDNKPFEEEEK